MIRSTTIIYEVLRKHDLSPLAYMLCDLIYKYTSVEGFCDKTLNDLAEELNSSSRTMSRYMTELTEKGTVEKIKIKYVLVRTDRDQRWNVPGSHLTQIKEAVNA